MALPDSFDALEEQTDKLTAGFAALTQAATVFTANLTQMGQALTRATAGLNRVTATISGALTSAVSGLTTGLASVLAGVQAAFGPVGASIKTFFTQIAAAAPGLAAALTRAVPGLAAALRNLLNRFATPPPVPPNPWIKVNKAFDGITKAFDGLGKWATKSFAVLTGALSATVLLFNPAIAGKFFYELKNLGAAVGSLLAPAMIRLTALVERLNAVISTTPGPIRTLLTYFFEYGIVLTAIITASRVLLGGVIGTVTVFYKLVSSIYSLVAAVAAARAAQLAQAGASGASAAASAANAASTAAGTAATAAFLARMWGSLGRLGQVGVALAALGTVAYGAYKLWQWVRGAGNEKTVAQTGATLQGIEKAGIKFQQMLPPMKVGKKTE